MVTVFVVVYIWLFVFYQVNYNSLGKSSSNAAVNDPADHLSVVVPQLFGIYVLGTIAFLYFLVDFVSHPIYLIKITEKSSKVSNNNNNNNNDNDNILLLLLYNTI